MLGKGAPIIVLTAVAPTQFRLEGVVRLDSLSGIIARENSQAEDQVSLRSTASVQSDLRVQRARR